MKRLTLYTMALSAGIAMSAQSSTSACMRVDMAKEVKEAVSVERGAKNEDAITNLGDTIRVASYNIRFDNADVAKFDGPNAWVHRKEALVNLIRKMNLDAFGLQEVTPGQAAYLRKALPEFEFVGEHRAFDRVSDEASPVAYRKDRFEAEKSGTFWLSETPDVPGSIGWGAALPRVCSYLVLRERSTGRRFCFANAHTDHVSALAREKGMLLIVDRMRKFGGGAPIVFTGDHNCRETEAPALAVSKILKNTLTNSETAPKGPWRTFNGWQWRDAELPAVDALKLPSNVRNASKGSPDADKSSNGGYDWCDFGPRIDYIYVSRGVRVLSCDTLADPRPDGKLYPSDHFPVSAEVAL